MSITLRLILGLSVMMVLFCAATATATAIVTRTVFVDEIDEIVTDGMATTARRLMPLILEREKLGAEDGRAEVHELRAFSDSFEADGEGASGFMAFEVRNPAGQVILWSSDAAAISLPQAPKPGYVHRRDILAYTVVDHDTSISLTILEPGEHRQEAISVAIQALLWPLAYLVPLMAIAILILTRFALAPVLGLSQQIAQRSGANLAPLDKRASLPNGCLP